MRKHLALITLLLIISCTDKKPGYWIKPENQNGIIANFYATDEYCELMAKNCPEQNTLRKLNKVINNFYESKNDKQELSELDGATLTVLEQIDFIHDEMILTCGGYCVKGYYLPILPYRKNDVRKFWSTTNNINALRAVIADYRSRIKLLGSTKAQFDVIFNITNSISQQNTINAMIDLKRIQVKIIDLQSKKPE